MRIKNSSNGAIVAERILVADTFFKRLQGLLGKDPLQVGHGLIIRPCSSVHTFGMSYPIDVLFVDSKNCIIKIVENMRPGRMSGALGSSYVIELTAGTARLAKCSIGDTVESQ